MSPLWLFLIVPASMYAGYFLSNWQWVAYEKRHAAARPKPSPYRR